jgi:NADH:ubiquinone oxidoreductase subunit 6 (subunit J)
LIPLALAVAALTWLLPRPRGRAVGRGAACGLMAFIVGGAFLLRSPTPISAETILFYAFSGFAVVGGVMLITQRNPARAAISFAVVIMNVGGLFLLQAAPFLMAATLIIYAGAIIVTFLFVLMLAQQTGFSDADDRSREPFLAALAGFVLLGALLIGLQRNYPDSRKLGELIERAKAARLQRAQADIERELGDGREFIIALRAETERHAGSEAAVTMSDAIEDLQEVLSSPQPSERSLRSRLEVVIVAGEALLDEERPKALPAANVAALGRSLFTDHLLAVELGGTLLLIATIGAIAIAGRRREAAA